MTLDAPGRIGIIGSGSAGLEAALYGRFLGYEVEVFESGEVADKQRRRGRVPMAGSFSQNSSPLGVAALLAQFEDYRSPSPDAVLDEHEFFQQYLWPLSQTDLLADNLRLQSCVTAIQRLPSVDDCRAEDEDTDPSGSYRLTVSGANGDRLVDVDVVIDTTQPNAERNLGDGLKRHLLAEMIVDSESANDDQSHLFVIGEQSGNDTPHVTANRFAQIRRLYCHLVGRNQLDVYANMRKMID